MDVWGWLIPLAVSGALVTAGAPGEGAPPRATRDVTGRVKGRVEGPLRGHTRGRRVPARSGVARFGRHRLAPHANRNSLGTGSPGTRE